MTPLTLNQVRADIAAVLDLPVPEIGDDQDLLDLGLDSMRMMTLAEQWAEAGADIHFVDLAGSLTVAGCWAQLSGQ